MENQKEFSNPVNKVPPIDLKFSFNNPEVNESLEKAENSYRGERIGSGEIISNRTSNMSYVLDTIEHQEVYVEGNDSSSEDSIHVEPVKLFIDGVEALSTPYDHIFSHRSILRLQILIDDAEKDVQIHREGCFINFFKCIKPNTNSELQDLREKVIILGKSTFDYNNSLHGNLILTWYSIIANRNTFKLEARIWQRLGFSSEVPNTNGLQNPGCPLILLHLIYFKEKSPENFQKFLQACLNPNSSSGLINNSAIIIKFSLKIFESSHFSRYLTQTNERPLLAFLNFHSGVIILWCNCFEQAPDKANVQAIVKETSKKIQNVNMIIDLFKSQSLS